jgi:hypothetical protein
VSKFLTAAALAFAALALPAAARADWGVRAGLETQLGVHINDGGSYSISDSINPAVDLLVLKGPSDLIGFGLEGTFGFASSGAGYQRTGEAVGPAVIVNLPVLPLFVRASLPIHIEPSPWNVGVRLGAGLKFNLPFVGFYLEGTADMPLVGGDNVKAFGSQAFSAGAGVEIRI